MEEEEIIQHKEITFIGWLLTDFEVTSGHLKIVNSHLRNVISLVQIALATAK